MLRFRLGRIPVEVHYGHFLVSAMLGLPSRGGAPTSEILSTLTIWIAVVFCSVLTHELGHALVSLAYGYRPQIQLVWSGGLTQPNAPAPIPWHRDILLTLAGPLLGLVLFGLASLGSALLRPVGYAELTFALLIWVNKNWSLLNLLPVIPLDGGRVAQVGLIRLFGRKGFLASQVVSLVVASGTIVYYLAKGQQLLLILLGLFAVRAVGQIADYFRGGARGGADPGEAVLNGARELYRQGKVDDARLASQGMLDSEATNPKARSGAHHLLGWIAIKEGQGRLALDHFSQVQGGPVEPQALAAAFSLVGDDVRSVAFWELAFRETQDSTVLHEWAGALIRAGRTQEALRLPNVDPANAYACAERVLFIRGNFSEAAKVGLAAMVDYPRAETAYDTACALARAGDRAGALRLLERASEMGFRDAGFAASDSDLSSLHGFPGFQAWLGQLRKSAPH